jgi:hypothetical protein
MKSIFLCVCVVVVLALTSCSDNGVDPKSATFLTVNLNANFMETAKDKWIFATNERGELLDVEKLKMGVTTQLLETTKSFATIDLTLVSIYKVPSSYTFYSMETFKGFPANEFITLGTPVSTPPAVAGNTAITITNYSESLDPRMNIKFSTQPYGASGVFSPNYLGTSYSVSALLYQGFNDVHIYGLRGNIPVYKMLSNVNVGDAISVDYNSFQAFDNYLELNSIYGFATVIGVGSNDTQFELIVSDKQSATDPRRLYIGTVPGFSRYLTYIASFSGFEYLKVGAAVSAFAPPLYTTTVTNNTLTNFKASISGDHDYKSAKWRDDVGKHQSTWIVYADNETHANIPFDFPVELTAVYPELTKDDLALASGNFVRSAGTYGYMDMINERLKGIRKGEYELYSMALK